MVLRAEDEGHARAARRAVGSVIVHGRKGRARAIQDPEVRVEVGRVSLRVAIHLDDQPVASRCGEAEGIKVTRGRDSPCDHRADDIGIGRRHRLIWLGSPE